MGFSRFFSFFRYLTWKTFKKTLIRIFKRRLTGLSAEIAYGAMLAIFPAILAMLTAIGMFEQSLQSTLHNLANQMEIMAPDQVWLLLRNFVEGVKLDKGRSWFSISFAAAIWISSGALSAAMNALDLIHQIPPQQRRPFWKAKLISLLLTIGTIFLLLIASFLILISDAIIDLAVKTTGASLLLTIWSYFNQPLGLIIVAIAFAFIYRFGPSRWIKGTPIFPGAILASFSWAGVSSLFRLYVTNFGNYNKIYGAVGAVIILMLWLYLSALIMLIGDQLNATVGEEMSKKRRKREELMALEQIELERQKN